MHRRALPDCYKCVTDFRVPFLHRLANDLPLDLQLVALDFHLRAGELQTRAAHAAAECAPAAEGWRCAS